MARAFVVDLRGVESRKVRREEHSTGEKNLERVRMEGRMGIRGVGGGEKLEEKQERREVTWDAGEA